MKRKGPADKPHVLLEIAARKLKAQWPGMTVRAVAGKLGISPSYWSKMLRGKKPLTPKLFSRITKVLGLDSQQAAELQRAMISELELERLAPATGFRVTEEMGSSAVGEYVDLGRNDFWLLSEWYYLPILNLFALANVEERPGKIAERLGLPASQVKSALLRLKQGGFLRDNAAGKLELTDRKIRFATDRSFAEVRRYHLQMLQKAKEELSLEAKERFDNRLISSLSLAGSSEKIREARLILEEAMYRAANLLADAPASDEIYQLSVQLFPLSRSAK